MACRMLRSIACAAAVVSTAGIKVGDVLPEVSLDIGFPPEKVTLQTLCNGQTLVLVGLPGAFTPTWSTKQIPGYLSKQDLLKTKGVDRVAVYAVNDGAVMAAWEKDQGTQGSLITLYGDPRSEVTKALDLVLDDAGPMAVLGNPRCKRFSMLVKNCKVKTLNVAAAADDPAGDERPEISMVDKMLEDLDKLKKDEL